MITERITRFICVHHIILMDIMVHVLHYVGHVGCLGGIFVCPWIDEHLQQKAHISRAEYK